MTNRWLPLALLVIAATMACRRSTDANRGLVLVRIVTPNEAPISRFRVTIVRDAADTLADTSASISPGETRELDLPVTAAPGTSTTTTLQLLGAGNALLYIGTATLIVHASGEPPMPAIMVITRAGP
jgi:hypothetical protein